MKLDSQATFCQLHSASDCLYTMIHIIHMFPLLCDPTAKENQESIKGERELFFFQKST